MKVGDLVHDFALDRDGIVISGSWFEPDGEIDWEWAVLYDGGEIVGADTLDLRVNNESR